MPRIRGLLPTTFTRAMATALRPVPSPKHVFVCIADHFEPNWRDASQDQADARIGRWQNEYPRLAEKFTDSRGRPPQHTFFYPAEIYIERYLEILAELTRGGWGDVEVHLHHADDTSERLAETLLEFVDLLENRHGLLTRDANGRLRYGFIHGNWALDNCRPDGSHCGVNDELTVLLRTGCYADFTYPSAPDVTQVRTINRIYYAFDDPDRPNSHDTGIAASVGQSRPDEGLLMIPGPLLVTRNLGTGRGLLKLENGNLADLQPPSRQRLLFWLKAAVGVNGHPDWSFVKLHTHGAQERNQGVLLEDPMRSFHASLPGVASELGFKYYYVTAREMAQLVKQAEAGLEAPDFDGLSFG